MKGGSAITAYWVGPGRGPAGGGGASGRGLAGVFKPARRGRPAQWAHRGWERRAVCALRQPPAVPPFVPRACARRAGAGGGGPSRLGQRLPGRVSSSPSHPAPCVSAEGFLRVPCPVRGGGRPSGRRRFPPRSRPGVCGASLWMRPRSPGREAARGKRCLRGFTAAWDSDPRRRRPLPRGAPRRPGSAAVPGRRHGREVPARADGGEGLPGPVLHPRPAAGQPR